MATKNIEYVLFGLAAENRTFFFYKYLYLQSYLIRALCIIHSLFPSYSTYSIG